MPTVDLTGDAQQLDAIEISDATFTPQQATDIRDAIRAVDLDGVKTEIGHVVVHAASTSPQQDAVLGKTYFVLGGQDTGITFSDPSDVDVNVGSYYSIVLLGQCIVNFTSPDTQNPSGYSTLSNSGLKLYRVCVSDNGTTKAWTTLNEINSIVNDPNGFFNPLFKRLTKMSLNGDIVSPIVWENLAGDNTATLKPSVDAVNNDRTYTLPNASGDLALISGAVGLRVLTQAQYDAIVSKDPDTVYIIKPA